MGTDTSSGRTTIQGNLLIRRSAFCYLLNVINQMRGPIVAIFAYKVDFLR